MTRAPRSAKRKPADGPARNWLNSMTKRPERGRDIAIRFCAWAAHYAVDLTPVPSPVERGADRKLTLAACANSCQAPIFPRRGAGGEVYAVGSHQRPGFYIQLIQFLQQLLLITTTMQQILAHGLAGVVLKKHVAVVARPQKGALQGR